MKKNIVIFNSQRVTAEVWLPTLWLQAKTYYEHHGQHNNDWNWYPSFADIYADDIDSIKTVLIDAKPDIFAISLYVWNSKTAFQIAKWVKDTFPKCLIISGGPQQHFKYNNNWFIEHPYIDASLPGDTYGELSFAEIIDNYNNGNVDWNQVTSARYPLGDDRMIGTSYKSLSKSNKRAFDFNWSSYESQKYEINEFIAYKEKHLPNTLLLAIIETTRGCPYGCTFCDWGGGTATAVIKKDINVVEQDIKVLTSINVNMLIISDANFGIFEDRDVSIIKKLIYYRDQSNQKFKVFYGGFAKSKKKLPYIKKILELDIKNELSGFKDLKISLQTFDNNVLKNINRINIDFETQLEVFSSLAKDNKLPIFVELIMGLPGIDLTIFYNELNTLGEYELSAMWFEWLMLPETPAYAPEYRQLHKLKTITKNNGWMYEESGADREIVIACSSYNDIDYIQMLLSTSMFHAITQGGYFKKSIKWIIKNKNVQLGDVISDMFKECFDINTIVPEWDQIKKESSLICEFNINGLPVFAGYFFVLVGMNNYNNFNKDFSVWLHKKYGVPKLRLMYDKFNIKPVKSKDTLKVLLDKFYNMQGDNAMNKINL